MSMRGIRGAITVEKDSREEVLSATRELLQEILAANAGLNKRDVASAVFTTTADLTAAFPALAARQIGWDQVPMICTHEIPVPGSLPACIRVLIHWNTEKKQEEVQHIYLREAKTLRPDLAAGQKSQKVN